MKYTKLALVSGWEFFAELDQLSGEDAELLLAYNNSFIDNRKGFTVYFDDAAEFFRDSLDSSNPNSDELAKLAANLVEEVCRAADVKAIHIHWD